MLPSRRTNPALPAIRLAALALTLLLTLLAPPVADAQIPADPTRLHVVYDEGRPVGVVYVDRDKGSPRAVEHWVMFPEYRLPSQIVPASLNPYKSVEEFLKRVPFPSGSRYARRDVNEQSMLPPIELPDRPLLGSARTQEPPRVDARDGGEGRPPVLIMQPHNPASERPVTERPVTERTMNQELMSEGTAGTRPSLAPTTWPVAGMPGGMSSRPLAAGFLYNIYDHGRPIGAIYVERADNAARYVQHSVLYPTYTYPSEIKSVELNPFASAEEFLAGVSFGPGSRYVRLEIVESATIPGR